MLAHNCFLLLAIHWAGGVNRYGLRLDAVRYDRLSLLHTSCFLGS
jgi:hypothetical protein